LDVLVVDLVQPLPTEHGQQVFAQDGLSPIHSARLLAIGLHVAFEDQTAAHLLEVLPQVPYRQWTLSLPGALRWLALKQPQLVGELEKRLVRAVWRWQRHQAKGLGVKGQLVGGAVSFVQMFSSPLLPMPHLHVLMPEGLWGEEGFIKLPGPSDEEVEALQDSTDRGLSL
jgi:hypothetical protein